MKAAVPLVFVVRLAWWPAIRKVVPARAGNVRPEPGPAWSSILYPPAVLGALAVPGINGNYARRTNRRHGRVGHLFQNRFYCGKIASDAHLISAILYVVRNPVTAGLCEHAGLWPDSSYRATVGLERAPRWLVVDQVLSLFGSSRESARAAFDRLVQSGQLLVSDKGLGEPLSDVDTATAVRSAA